MKVNLETNLDTLNKEVNIVINSAINHKVLIEYGDLIYRHNLIDSYFEHLIMCCFYIIAFRGKLDISDETLRDYFYILSMFKNLFGTDDFQDILNQDLIYPDTLNLIKELNKNPSDKELKEKVWNMYFDIASHFQDAVAKLMNDVEKLNDIFQRVCLRYDLYDRPNIEKDFNIEIESTELSKDDE